MIKSQKIRLQKILYGTFFIFVLPLYFIFLANSVSLPFEVPELGYGGSVMANNKRNVRAESKRKGASNECFSP